MERDDIVEYSLYYHHDNEAGKKIRKKIYMVTFIMTVITIIELFVGIVFSKTVVGIESGAWQGIKIGYLVLTVIKAGYIVMVFMHLGDEKKALKWVILAPYILFILYLVFICLTEATYISHIWKNYP